MKRPPSIVEAQAVIHGVLRLKFDDGYEGVVDLRPLIAKGKDLAWLSTPERFAAIKIDELGHSVSWSGDDGSIIDLSADWLRRESERHCTADDTDTAGVGWIVTIAVFVVSLMGLAFGALCAWRLPFTVGLGTYQFWLNIGAIVACIYGAITVFRVVTKFSAAGKLRPQFQKELIGYILFWVLVPPLWFFLEFYAVDNHFIGGSSLSDSELRDRLMRIKDYADYASKIWLALAGLLLGAAVLKSSD